MTTEETLSQLYTNVFGVVPEKVLTLAGAGSNRCYYRLTSMNHLGEEVSAIGTIGTNVDENRAFVALSNHFVQSGLSVPRVYAVAEDYTAYIQEDLGDVSLFDAIAQGRSTGEFSEDEVCLLERSIRMMVKLHGVGADAIDWDWCYPEKAMDGNMIKFDLNYFKYCFLKLIGIDFSESTLELELSKLYESLAECAQCANGFMARDFQSRNVMMRDGEPYLIDFQGGRRGPVEYDVASFLWQARASLPQRVREHLIDVYIKEARVVISSFDESGFRDNLPKFVLFRMLQTLGAYGLRGIHEKKPHFLSSIPKALNNLAQHLNVSGLSNDFPYLTEICGRLLCDANVMKLKRQIEIPSFEGLTVTVASFSYKKGIPADLSGNGGGFAFDCRAVHNPGRYDEYKTLTGRDEAVKKFLEDDGEILTFLSHVYGLVDSSVSRYLKRGFKSLCVNFGCTGGQHRSVYSAEATARYIADRFPQVRVVLMHREQNILEIINPKFV